MVSSLSETTGLNLWRNSKAVLNWFSLLQNKQKLTFFKFDVCSFYPSISEELFAKAIDFARSKVTITDEQVKIMRTYVIDEFPFLTSRFGKTSRRIAMPTNT